MTLTQVNSKGIKDSEIVNADVASGAAIDQSKLNLSISNSQVASDAAIDQSKLNLSISNSNVASNAAIDISKINTSSLSISNSNVSNSTNIDIAKINLSGLSISNSQVASNAAISQSKLQLGITDTEVASAAGINSNKLSFTQTGTGASARTVANRFQDTISVKDFGALGNGSNNDTTAIQNALNQAAVAGVSVYLPAGTYIVHDTIRIPSDTHFFGSGEKSIIKMNKDIDNITTLVRTGERNDKRKNIVIENMTLDFNRERWQYRDSSQSNYLTARTNNASGTRPADNVINDGAGSMNYGGDAEQDHWGCTLSICFSENVLIRNVKALDGYKHTIDITSPKYRRGFSGSNSDFENGGATSLQGPQIYDTVKQTGTASKSSGSKVITVNITNHGYDAGDEIYLNCSGTIFDKLYRIETKINDNSFTVIALRSDQSFNTSCYVIQDQGSKHVTLENCHASGAGDDNITTHFSSHLLITGCTSEFPSGRLVPQNSNCYEIDDGSRNVTMTNCTARGGCKGLQIKGHSYAPAPYNIIVDGFRVVNCAEGMDIKHTSWGKTAVETGNRSGNSGNNDFINLINNWGGGQTLTNPDHQIRSGSITYMGASPTAKNVSISNVQIIAPKGFRGVIDDDGTGLQKADKQIQLYAYENVQFTNILISDGRFDLAGDQDLALSALAENDAGTDEADTSLDEIVHVFYGAQSVSFKNLAIHGFRSANFGLKVTSSLLQHFLVDGLIILDGPNTGVEFSETYGNWTGVIDNYLILRPDTSAPGVSGSVGIHNNELDTSFKIGNGNIVRYETDVKVTDE